MAAGVAVAAVVIIAAAGAFSTTHHVKVVTVFNPPAAAPTAPATTSATVAPDPRSHEARAGKSTVSPSAGRGAGLLRPGARASFGRLRSRLSGPVTIALVPLGAGRGVTLGSNATAHAWSTSKVPVLAALLRARGARGLTGSERGWARLAITESDNGSILSLFGDLKRLKGGLIGASNYVQGLLRDSGDDQTVVATAPPPPSAVTTFGQTQWAPHQSALFFRALGGGCLLSAVQTSYVIGLMEHIDPSESWGLGSAGFGVPVAFKGGWGPEPGGGYLVRQSGVIDPGSPRGVAVSIVAYAHGNSFGAGTSVVTTAARWLRSELTLRPAGSAGCGGR